MSAIWESRNPPPLSQAQIEALARWLLSIEDHAEPAPEQPKKQPPRPRKTAARRDARRQR